MAVVVLSWMIALSTCYWFKFWTSLFWFKTSLHLQLHLCCYCPSLHINYFISLPEVPRLWFPMQTLRLQELPASPFCLSWPQAATSCSFSSTTLWDYAAKWIYKLRHNKNIPAAPFYFLRGGSASGYSFSSNTGLLCSWNTTISPCTHTQSLYLSKFHLEQPFPCASVHSCAWEWE